MHFLFMSSCRFIVFSFFFSFFFSSRNTFACSGAIIRPTRRRVYHFFFSSYYYFYSIRLSFVCNRRRLPTHTNTCANFFLFFLFYPLAIPSSPFFEQGKTSLCRFFLSKKKSISDKKTKKMCDVKMTY